MTATAIRALTSQDYADAHALYSELVGHIPAAQGRLGETRFAEILTCPGTTLFGAERAGVICSMATLHVLPNMTYEGRPYALVENVVTLKRCQGQGLGRQVMEAAIRAAWAQNAYKVMLLTGKKLGACGFYEKLGFTSDEKFGMTLRRVPPRK